MSKDYCTWFPEYWYTWKGELIYIGWMCKDHDNHDEGEEFEGCANTGFYKNTWKAHLIGATIISTIASAVCLVRYFKKQIRRF